MTLSARLETPFTKVWEAPSYANAQLERDKVSVADVADSGAIDVPGSDDDCEFWVGQPVNVDSFIR